MATGGPSGGNTDSLIKFALLQPAPEGMIYNPLTGVNEYSYAVTTTGGQVRLCSLSRWSGLERLAPEFFASLMLLCEPRRFAK